MMMRGTVLTRRQAVALGAAAAASGLSGLAQAEETPMRLQVTFPPGGSTDIASRIIQPRLSELAGRAVVVENRPGAASQIATQYVAKSAPDGNTLLVSFDTHAINPIAKPRLPYDTFKDFTGVTLAVRFPLVIGANAQAVQGMKDLRDFLKEAKANPGKFSYASTGLGSMNHLVMEDIKRRSGTFVLHVPFGGGGPAVQAVLGNVTTLTLLSYAALRGQISAGKVKPLAVTGAKRLPELPDVPTVAESGFPGFEAATWGALIGPARIPAPVARRIAADAAAQLQVPAVRERFGTLGATIVGSGPEEAQRFVAAEVAKWSEVAKTAGIEKQ